MDSMNEKQIRWISIKILKVALRLDEVGQEIERFVYFANQNAR